MKSIKTNDQALARILALNSDVLGPLTELLELLNREDEEDEVPDLHKRVWHAVESAITLLGNAYAQMSALRRQKVLEDYNKELIIFAQEKEREAEFLKAAPDLFGSKFPRDATEHLAQLAALQKAKASSSSNRPLLPLYSQPILHQGSGHNLTPGKAKEEGAHQEGAERTQVTIDEQLYCVSTNLIFVNPMLLKAQSMGFISPPKAMESLMVVGRLVSFIDAWKVLTRDFGYWRP